MDRARCRRPEVAKILESLQHLGDFEVGFQDQRRKIFTSVKENDLQTVYFMSTIHSLLIEI